MRNVSLFSLVLGSMLLSSSSAEASTWQEQLREQTQIKSGSGYADLSSNGFTLVDVAQTELLAASSSSDVSVSLAPGSEYIIMGVCDNDCLDLDLALLKSGIELGKDTTTDDWPLLKVTPTSSGDYTVRVTMYDCNTATCGYQLSIWRR